MLDVLAQVEIFAGLSSEELEMLAGSSVSRQYPKNTVIINDGDNADSLYLIDSGRLKVYCSDNNGNEIIMNNLEARDDCGEMDLLYAYRRSASVRTMEKCSFRIIYKEDFQRVISENPNIARILMRNLTRRVRTLTDKVKSLALQDVYGRVTKVLTGLARPRDDESYFIEERLTQQDIADRVGASREMVARILKDLTIGEYIGFEGRNIVINGKLPASY